MTIREPAILGNADTGWLEKCRNCVANWLAARRKLKAARRLDEELARMDPHLLEDIGMTGRAEQARARLAGEYIAPASLPRTMRLS